LSERIPCEFFLVRYVPDVVKGEFVNIGVLLREAVPVASGRERTVVRFTRDWGRVRCIDADADVALLEGMEAEIAALLASEASPEAGRVSPWPILALLQDTLSNSVYVEPLRVKIARQRTGRAAIAASMRSEFERAGVWAMMRKRINASMYTRAGDPMKIDCGYRPNGVIRMFHAVSLENDVEAAKGLAYSAPQLREGVGRVEGAALELSAVVEPLRMLSAEGFTDEAAERYRFGVEAMEREEIRVITVSDLARAAETARVELGF
jgi:hypothetical protein